MPDLKLNTGFFARTASNKGANKTTYNSNMFTDLNTPTQNIDDPKTVTIFAELNNKIPIKVRGFLLQPISYSLSAEWTSGGLVSSAMQKIDGALNSLPLEGVSLGNTGFASKKYYKGGGDLSTNIQFRIYAPSSSNPDHEREYATTNAEGIEEIKKNTSGSIRHSLIKTLEQLKMMVLPSTDSSLGAADFPQFQEFLDQGEANARAFNDKLDADEIKKIKELTPSSLKEKMSADAANSARADAEKTLNLRAAKELGDKLGEGKGAKILKNTISTGLQNRITTLKAARLDVSTRPPYVTVNVGTWFSLLESVITNITFTYSNAVNSTGPLWCDVSIDVVTGQNMALNNLSQMKDSNAPLLDNVQLFDRGAMTEKTRLTLDANEKKITEEEKKVGN
jgi:hypothetical protein